MTGLTFGQPDPRLPSGQCWVCDEPDTVPAADRQRIPAICSDECRDAWVRMLAIGGFEEFIANAEAALRAAADKLSDQTDAVRGVMGRAADPAGSGEER